MFRIRLVEQPMPTGSKDTDVLLEWLIDSLSLVRRKAETWGPSDEPSALHRMFREAILAAPLQGWNTRELGDACGLSQTAMHNQMARLRESGLVASELDGRWHIHVLRGGSMSNAIELVSVQARKILEMRLTELSALIEDSNERMKTPIEDEDLALKINISEPGATANNQDRIDALLNDLGLNGERAKKGDNLARKVFLELAQSHNAITMLALADRFDETRSRIQRTLERMREVGIIERVAMPERIAQDVFAGLMRQYDARGEEWLMNRGGVGRLPESVAKKLISDVKKKKLSIEKVEKNLADIPLENQKLLINTLGGRMPYGFRIAGKTGAEMSEKILNRCDRTLRRLRTVAKRLDESLQV